MLYCIALAFVKDQLTVFMWIYSWSPYYVERIYFSTLSPVPHRIDWCSFTVRLEVLSVLQLHSFPSTLCLNTGFSSLQIHFRIHLLIFVNAGILTEIVLDLQIKLGRTDILIIFINMGYLFFWHFKKSECCSFPHIDLIPILLNLYLSISFGGILM